MSFRLEISTWFFSWNFQLDFPAGKPSRNSQLESPVGISSWITNCTSPAGYLSLNFKPDNPVRFQLDFPPERSVCALQGKIVSYTFYFCKCYHLNGTIYDIVSFFDSWIVNKVIQFATIAKIKYIIYDSAFQNAI